MQEQAIDQETTAARLLFGREDAAQSLGVSVRTVDNLVAERQLKARRVGKRVLFTLEELQRFARGR